MIIILASNFCTNFLKILFPIQNDFFSQVTMKKVFNSGTAQTKANSNERKEKKKPRIIFRKKAGQRKEERRGPSGVKILNEVQESHSSGTSYHLLFLADVATTMLVPRFA